MLIEDPLLQSQNECRAGTCPKPVQELPTLYKLVPLYRLPLTRTARPVVVPYDPRTHPHRRARTRRGYAASVALLRRERLR